MVFFLAAMGAAIPWNIALTEFANFRNWVWTEQFSVALNSRQPFRRNCIFMHEWKFEEAICKVLVFSSLCIAFQKCHFWLAKVALLGDESWTFSVQKFNFWKVKVQPYIYTSFSVCLCRACFGVIFIEFPFFVVLKWRRKKSDGMFIPSLGVFFRDVVCGI